MSFNRTAFRDVCDRSGFTKGELARIYGTTRQTIYDWGRKAQPTQLALAIRAEKTTAALSAALHAKVLPMSALLSKENREKRIDSIIKVIMESMKPGKA